MTKQEINNLKIRLLNAAQPQLIQDYHLQNTIRGILDVLDKILDELEG